MTTEVPAWVLVAAPAVSGALAVVGTVGGYWLNGKNDEARDQRTAQREAIAHQAERERDAAARQDERDIQRDIWSHEFQRDLLLQLQDELQKLVRSCAKVILQDQATLRERGQLFLLPPGMSDEAYDIGVSVSRLTARLLDDQVRQAVEEFRTACITLEFDGAVKSSGVDPEALGKIHENNMAQLNRE